MSEISQQWAIATVAALFGPEDSRLHAMLKKVIDKNNEVLGVGAVGISFLGEYILLPEYKDWFKSLSMKDRVARVPTPAREVSVELGAYVADRNAVNIDKKRISTVLNKMLCKAVTLQDVRNCIPDCAASLMPQIRSVDRTNPDPCFLVANDFRVVNEFNKLLPRIEFYAMTRLMY